MKLSAAKKRRALAVPENYGSVLSGMVELLQAARRASARTVNAIMTATYWEIGRRIVEFEQGGSHRAAYGEQLLLRLSADLAARFGRGFGYAQVRLMRQFFLSVPRIRQSVIGEMQPGSHPPEIGQSAIGESNSPAAPADVTQAVSKGSPADVLRNLSRLANCFPLSWTHYTRLLRVQNPLAREFYQAEALRAGWTVRQLERQIGTQFYERAALSRNKTEMLRKGERPRPEDTVTPDEEIRSPLILEFLGLKDEYSETDLEDALIRHLESFLLELGGEFAFVGRQKRLRIDHEWFRIDLLFFHRRLRSLVVIDLKTGPLSHADIGQMHLYLNYARVHWAQPGENPPVGLILCTEQGESLARYALEGLPNKMLVREYKTTLPSEQLLAAELARARQSLERRKQGQGAP